jgi:hypothetical protein
MSVSNAVTCLSTWGQTGAIPSRLALFARPAPPAHGLDRLAPARRALGKRLKAWWERHVPLATHAATLANGAIQDPFAASSSTVRSREQKTSVLTLEDQIGSSDKFGFAGLSLFGKKGQFLRPHQSHAVHRAQAEVNDRASDREAAPKASRTAASAVCFSGSEA